MTTTVGGINVFLDDNTGQFQTSFRALASFIEQSSNRMGTAIAGTEQSVRNLSASTRSFSPDAFKSLSLSALRARSDIDSLKSLMLALPALGGGFGGALLSQQLAQRADSYTNLKNRIASVVEGSREQIAAERDLFDIAQRTRSALQANASLFQRIRSASPQLAQDPDNLLRVVETVQKSFSVAGATTNESQSAALQLSQALGSGRLQGDELRSILENNIPLAGLIAKEFGVGIGQLKQLGADGTLTTDRVIKAILDGSVEIDATFKRLKPTIESSIVVLSNALTKTIGDFDEATGISAKLASGIIGVASNMDALKITALGAAAAIASVLSGRIVSGSIGRVGDAVKAQKDARDKTLKEAQKAQQNALDESEKSRRELDRANADRDKSYNKGVQLGKGASLGDAAQSNRENNTRADTAITKAVRTEAEATNKLYDLQAQRQALVAAQTQYASAAKEKSIQKELDGLKKIEAASQANLQKRINLQNELDAKKSQAFQMRESGQSTNRIDGQIVRLEKAISEAEGKAKTLASAATLQRGSLAGAQLMPLVSSANTSEIDRKIAAQQTLIQKAGGEAQKIESDAKRSALNAAIAAQNNVAVSRIEASKALAAGDANASAAAAKHAENQKALSAAMANTGAAQAASTVGASRLGAAWSGLSAVGSSLYGFLGGPWGLAVTAASLGIIAYGVSTANAAAENERFKKNAEAIPDLLRRIAEAGSTGVSNSTRTELNSTLLTAEAARHKSLGDAISEVGRVAALAGSDGIKKLNDELGLTPQKGQSAEQAFRAYAARALESSEGTKTLIGALERLGATNIDLSGPVSEALRVVGAMAAAAGQVNALVNAMAGISKRGSSPKFEYSENELVEKRINDANAGAIREAELLNDLIDQGNRKREVAAKLEGRMVDAARDKRATRQEELKDQIQADNRRAGLNISDDDALRQAKQIEAIEKATADAAKKGRGGSGRKGFTPEEKFDNKVELIKQEGRSSFFSDLDRQLISQLREIKSDPNLAEKTVDALKSGKALPERAQELRDALEQKRAGELARDARDQYGSLAEVLPLVAERQRLLNLAVANGNITQETANRAVKEYADNLPQIKKAREGTDALVDGLANIGYSGITNGFKNIGKSFADLALEMSKMLILAPLLKQFKDSLAGSTSLSSGGGLGGLLGSIVSGIGGVLGFGGSSPTGGVYPTASAAAVKMHSGGIVGMHGQRMSVSPSLFNNAPRFHSGLKTNEFAAILEQGEAVLTRKHQRGISAMLDTPAPSFSQNVTVNNYTKSEVKTSKDSNGNLLIEMMDATNARGASQAISGRGALAGFGDPRALASQRPG